MQSKNKIIKHLRGAVCALLAALLAVSPVGSLFAGAEETDVVTELVNGTGYSAVLYDNTNGLPTSEANAIAETGDGFMWIGSYGGLIKYDGSAFERIQPAAGVSSVVDLFVDSKDRLWIGTNDSGVACMNKGDTRVFNKADGLRSLYVHTVAEDKNGNIYIGTELGVAIINENMELRLLDNAEYERVRDLRLGADGLIYGSTTDGAILTIKDGEPDKFYAGLRFGGETIYSFAPDLENPGYVYVGTTGDELYYGLFDGNFDSFKKISIAPLKYVNDICQEGGRVWICADNGIGLYQNGVFTAFEGLPMVSSLETMMTDYQGNVWFASSKQGVMKIVPNRFEDVFSKYGIETNVVNATCRFEGKLFIACKTNGLVVLDESGARTSFPVEKAVYASGGEISEKDLVKLMEGSQIRSIISNGNRIWFSTMYGEIPIICYENGVATCYTGDDGLPSERARAVVECKDGSAVAVLTGGLARIRNGKVEKVYTESDGIENTDLLTAAEAANGDIIAGTNGNGVYIVSDDKVTHIGTDSGLMSEVVMRVKKDVTRDIYWLVTSNSISYLDADYNVTNVTNFPYSNNFDLYENAAGDNMWVLSSAGIYVVTVSEMLENGDVSALLYNRHNGLPCVATANSYSAVTPDGDLYVAGTSGVVRVNIEKPFEDLGNIKTAVPYIEVDGEVMFPDENGVFTVPAATQRLTICEFVFTYSLIDPNVSYILEGFENEPTEKRRSDLLPVNYTNLRGGTYHFRMSLLDSHGEVENEISVTIIKEKAIYEQTWFVVAAIILGVLLVALAVFLIMRRKTQKLLKKEAEQRVIIKEITEVLAKTIDMKDKYTNGHSARVAKYTAMLAKELGYDDETVEKYYNIALLHDIGKISVPEEVLNKNGKLDDEEFRIIKSHPELGGETLREITIMPELAIGAQSHHERPDGKGYPQGLKQGEIPRVAQIIAVADTFDAMYSDRPYRKRMNFDKVVSIMKEVKGTQLTADVVDAFLRLVDKGEMRAPDDVGGGTTEDIDNLRRKFEEDEKKKKEEE